MTTYKVQLVQELKPIDHPMHFRFAKWACDLLTKDDDFGQKKFIFSDEAHFDVDVDVVLFGARKTRTPTLKSRHTQNE